VSGREEAPGRRVHDQDRLSDRELPRACLPVRRRCVHLYPALPVRLLANPPTGSRHPASGCALYADRGYDHDKFARLGSSRSSPVAASNLIPRAGVYRWVVEQGFALLHWFRRLRIRWEIRDDIHEAFLRFACAIICWRRLHNTSKLLGVLR
jgi:hypothetical protein